MSYCDKLCQEYPEVWQATRKSSFIEDLNKGTLSHDKFRNFVIQRYVISRFLKKFMGVLFTKIPFYYENAGGVSAGSLLGQCISNNANEIAFEKYKRDLKITDEEVHADPIVHGFCSFIMMIAYNANYKDALIVLLSFKGTLQHFAEGQHGDNALFKQEAQEIQKQLATIVGWAENALNDIMKTEPNVTKKHQHVLLYALQWRAQYLHYFSHPQLHKWSVPVKSWV
jgi:thiaminase